MKEAILYNLFLYKVFVQLFYQLMLSNWYTHDLMVSFRIYQVLVADNFNQLAVIDLWNNHMLKIADNFTQVLGKGRK